jgi:protein ImuA
MVFEIAHLREALAKPGLAEAVPCIPLGFGPADAELKGGLRRGALHEVFAGAGHEICAAGFAAGLALRLAENRPLLWISQSYATQEHGGLCPTGLFEFGLDPSKLILLSVAHAQNALRAAADALTCGPLGAVIIEIIGHPKILDLTASRRLVLACERQGVPAVLLRFGAIPQTSAAETRWLVKGAPSDFAGENWGQPAFDVSLIRNRSGRLGEWTFAWSCDDGHFAETKAASGAVVSAPSHRQAKAA